MDRFKGKRMTLSVDLHLKKMMKRLALKECYSLSALFYELFYTTPREKLKKGHLTRKKQISSLNVSMSKRQAEEIKEYCIINDLTVSDLLVYLYDTEFDLHKHCKDYVRD